MILILSEASMVFKETEDGVFHPFVSGYGYKAAKYLASNLSFPTLIAPLGNDRAGSDIVEKLVEEQIMFDPDLSRDVSRTNIEICYKDGSSIDFFKSSASAKLSEESLSLSLSIHSNIKAVLMDAKSLSVNPTSNSYTDQTMFLSPRPYTVVDLSVDAEYGFVLDKAINDLLPFADLFILEKGKNEEALGAKMAIVKDNKTATIYKNGLIAGQAEFDNTIESPVFASKILLKAEESLFFLDDGEDMVNYEMPISMIEDAIRG